MPRTTATRSATPRGAADGNDLHGRIVAGPRTRDPWPFRLRRGVPLSPAGHQTPPQPTQVVRSRTTFAGRRARRPLTLRRESARRSFPDGDPRTIAGRRKDGDARPSTPRVHEGPGGLRPLDAPGAAIDADLAVPGAAHGRRRPRRAPARRAVGPALRRPPTVLRSELSDPGSPRPADPPTTTVTFEVTYRNSRQAGPARSCASTPGPSSATCRPTPAPPSWKQGVRVPDLDDACRPGRGRPGSRPRTATAPAPRSPPPRR